MINEASVVGTVFLGDGPSGELAAYLGIDLSAVELSGEGEKLIRIDDHLLKDNARRLEGRKALSHLGLPLLEGGNHLVVRNLADALVILAAKPGNSKRAHNHGELPGTSIGPQDTPAPCPVAGGAFDAEAAS